MDITFFTFLKAHFLDYPHLETEIPPLEVVNPRLEINSPQMFKLTIKPISFFGNVNFCFWISGLPYSGDIFHIVIRAFSNFGT